MKDLRKTIESDVLEVDNGMKMIMAAIYKIDTLFVASDLYHDFHHFLCTRRHVKESYR